MLIIMGLKIGKLAFPFAFSLPVQADFAFCLCMCPGKLLVGCLATTKKEQLASLGGLKLLNLDPSSQYVFLVKATADEVLMRGRGYDVDRDG